jgi:diacylglycerol O-acyltransferase
MPALSVVDLAMFMLESPARPFNIAPLIVLEPPARSREGFADRLVARMLKRPAGYPFTHKLVTPRLGLPRLALDPELDPSRHVHRMTLKRPGTLQHLFDELCEIHQKQLPRTRPLWEFYVIDGLDGGKVALYGKMHHGIIDGRTSVKVISDWLSTSPRERQVRAMWEGVGPRARGTRTSASVAKRLSVALGQAAGTAKTAASVYRMVAEQALARLGVRLGKTLMLPFTSIPNVLKGRFSTRRSFAFCALPLEELKALGHAHGVKLNDLMLATLDIGLNRYLEEVGKRPNKPLVVAMPVALTGAKGGNQIAILQFPLGAPGKSAKERLEQICAHTATVKDVVQRESSETVMLFTTLVHGLPAVLDNLGLKGGGVSVSNLVFSNPFGLPERRYLMGARAELALPLSVVNAGQMLNVTAVTHDDVLQLGFLAIPDAVPKVHRLAHHTREAFDELKAALDAPEAPPAPKKRPAVKRAARARI